MCALQGGHCEHLAGNQTPQTIIKVARDTAAGRLWVHTSVRNVRKQEHGLHVKALVYYDCRESSYIALKLRFALLRQCLVHRKMLIHERDLLHAANPSNAGVSPMQVLGSTKLPLSFQSEAKVFTTLIRVVRDLPSALILGTSILRSDHSVISLAPDKGFQPDPIST